MTTVEIEAFARKTTLNDAYKGKGVVGYVTAIKDGEKNWLGHNGFTENKESARLVNYDYENVGEQILQVALQTGNLLDFEAVEPEIL